VIIVENPPSLSRGVILGGHEVVIAGHSASYLPAGPGHSGYAAQWKTAAARYLAFMNGKTDAGLKRLVKCLP